MEQDISRDENGIMDLNELKRQKIKIHMYADEVNYLTHFLSFVCTETEGIFENEEDKRVILGIGLKLLNQAKEKVKDEKVN